MNTKVKTILKYLLMGVAGLLLGWILFHSPKTVEHDHGAPASAETEYTCSMHPQIRQKGPGKCPLCGMDLIPASKAGYSTNPMVHEMTPEAIAMANIQTTKVKAGSTTNELHLTGKIQVNEHLISSITSKFSGRIENLHIHFEGQQVQKGQRVASIYSPELINAQRELLEAVKMKNVAPEIYEASKQKLRYWKITEKQIDHIETSGNVVTTIDVFAESSGVITSRKVSTGDYVSTGSILFEVANLNPVWVILDAYESDLSSIRIGTLVTFTVPSLPGHEFTTKVSIIHPLIDPVSRVVAVHAEVPNPGNTLKPEMLVNARIKTAYDSNEKGIAIPASAVLWTGKRSLVYVKKMNGPMPAFERREITLGPKSGDLYIIEKGLNEGEEVVTNGVFTVDASAQLSGNYSMMSTPENKSIEVPDAFREQLTKLTNVYFELKNALVNSDVETSIKKAAGVLKSLQQVDMNLLEEKAHAQWMILHKQIEKGATDISNEKNIEAQRKSFQLLSDHLIEAVELFGLTRNITYRAYCPMAFGNKGAYWLSEVEEIRNPYFGSAMLSCGENRSVYNKDETKQSK